MSKKLMGMNYDPNTKIKMRDGDMNTSSGIYGEFHRTLNKFFQSQEDENDNIYKLILNNIGNNYNSVKMQFPSIISKPGIDYKTAIKKKFHLKKLRL